MIDQMDQKEKISVILPTYNEIGNILVLIDDINKTLVGEDYEIVVVDDNSQDGTYQAVADLECPYVKSFRRTEGKGLANSIKYGLLKSEGSIVVVMDSDLNHRVCYLPFMIYALSHFDCVTASRFLYGGGMGSSWTNQIRNALSWLFNIFIRVMTGTLISDSLYGYFAIRKAVIDECCIDKIFWGYGDYFIRLMFYLQRREVRILQLPAVSGERVQGVGNKRFIHTFCQYFWATLQLTFRERLCFRKR
jgi:dolichol-phosphate mannosyltransferase